MISAEEIKAMLYEQEDAFDSVFNRNRVIRDLLTLLNQAAEALEINTRKTGFIVRDYPDDKEAKKGVALGKQALTAIEPYLTTKGE